MLAIGIDRSDPSGNPNHKLNAGRPSLRIPAALSFIPQALVDTTDYSDPSGLDRPLWRDISQFQGTCRFDIMDTNGVQGVIARAGVSWGYEDPRFQEFWAGIGAVHLYRSSYHVIYTDQPVLDQFNHWVGIHPELDPDYPIPRVIDLEVNRGDSLDRKQQATWEMVERVQAHDGLAPIIYSRRLLIDDWLRAWDSSQINTPWYWLAQYLFDRTREHPGNPPTLPNKFNGDASRLVLHQTADLKPGFFGEVQSSSVDWDRWEIGTEAEMHQWIAENWGPEQPPEDPTLDEKVEIMWNAHYGDGPHP